jgi:diguanylate cyclase (GGDEF)-like protein
MPMRTILFACPIAFVLIAGAAVGQSETDKRLPLSVDERIQACAQAEDAEPERAIALADSVLAGSPVPSLAQRAEALGCRGWSYASMHRRDDARRDAYSLRDLLLQQPRSSDRVRLDRRAGSILHRSGDRIGAIDQYARALADAEAQALEAERIPLLVNLGVLHSEFEEHERARVNYEQALALMAHLDDLRFEAPVRYNLGLNLSGQQRPAEAVPHLRRALELVRGSGMGGPSQELAVIVALASALINSNGGPEAQALLDQARAAGLPTRDTTMRLQMVLIDSTQLAASGNIAGALALLDAHSASELDEIQQWQWLKRRADLQQQLGRHEEANLSLRRIIELREAWLQHKNHERLSALEAHLRDREQRQDFERLQAGVAAQDLRLAATARLQWATASGASLLLLIGSSVLLWQRRMNRRLDEASRTDPLTGLSNRRDMAQRLRALPRNSTDMAAVLLIDIDLFKRINDQHGHDVGDEVLVTFARRLRECAGDQASVARWGGEEFLVLLPRTDAAATRGLADALRLELARPMKCSSGMFRVAASTGFANLPLAGAGGAEHWHHSLQLADAALYLAKRCGRDAWAGFWIDRPIADWPPERLGRESQLARSLGVIEAISSRPLREPLTAVGA